MDVIAFRCSSCEKGLKVPADKAGRKVKCSRCGTEQTVPRQDAITSKQAPAPKKDAPEPGGGYGFADEATEVASQANDEIKPKKKAPKIKARIKTIQDPENWARVRVALNVVQIAIYLWAGAFALERLVFLLGLTAGPEYAAVAEKILVAENPPEPALGDGESLNIPGFLIGLISGESLYGVAKALLILACVVGLAQWGTALAGYSACLVIPDHQGTRGQVKTLLALAAANLVLSLIFKLLPLTGAMNYALVPWFTPELCIIDANSDRSLPIHIFWSSSGFWEMLLSILVMSCYYAEPVMLGVLLWSIGSYLREPPLEEVGVGVVEITFGVAFTLLSYYLLSVTGTSPVLLILLRVGYGLWILFTTILLVRFVMAINKAREIIGKYVQAADEAAEESDEPGRAAADEEEDDWPPRARKKKRRYEDEEDEEDEDDDT